MESINTWRYEAACRLKKKDFNFFFPKSTEAAESKKFCTGCDVISLCKTYALAHDEFGIWGGTTRHERLRYNPQFILVIREMYYQQGLLEYRSSEPVRDFLKQKEEQQQEHKSRTFPQQKLQDSKIDQSLAEPA